MFIAALFTIAEIWKQPKCPSRNEWIKQRIDKADIYIYTHTNTHNISATTWMDLEGIILFSGKDKYCMFSLICDI